MRVWRLARRAYQELDGRGARRFGGRWNSQGIAVVYTSSTLALAALEYLVHLDVEDAPDDLVALAVQILDDAPVESVTVEQLPDDWNQVPDHPACIEIGDRWVAERTALALRVPSAVVPEEANVLINPAHPDADRVRVASSRAFAFDPRLL